MKKKDKLHRNTKVWQTCIDDGWKINKDDGAEWIVGAAVVCRAEEHRSSVQKGLVRNPQCWLCMRRCARLSQWGALARWRDPRTWQRRVRERSRTYALRAVAVSGRDERANARELQLAFFNSAHNSLISQNLSANFCQLQPTLQPAPTDSLVRDSGVVATALSFLSCVSLESLLLSCVSSCQSGSHFFHPPVFTSSKTTDCNFKNNFSRLQNNTPTQCSAKFSLHSEIRFLVWSHDLTSRFVSEQTVRPGELQCSFVNKQISQHRDLTKQQKTTLFVLLLFLGIGFLGVLLFFLVIFFFGRVCAGGVVVVLREHECPVVDKNAFSVSIEEFVVGSAVRAHSPKKMASMSPIANRDRHWIMSLLTSRRLPICLLINFFFTLQPLVVSFDWRRNCVGVIKQRQFLLRWSV